jgi:hypothetical protein
MGRLVKSKFVQPNLWESPAEAQLRVGESFYRDKLRTWAPGAIGLARRRELHKAAEGRLAVAVEVTVDQLMAKLAANNYRCALSRLKFWDDDGGSYGPTCPSIDRIDPKGPYSDNNTRVVLLGVNMMRGEGSDEDMYRMAKALCRHRYAHG